MLSVKTGKTKKAQVETILYPEQIMSKVLEKMKTCACNRANANVSKCVISVPAYFNDS